MDNVVAYWEIELNTTCPSCDQDVNLLDDPDFWDGRNLEIGETMTDRSRNVNVFCPECQHEFTVELQY